MRIIIPVAGVGTRLKPHTDTTPKPLLEVAGRPVLDHVLRPFESLEVEEVVFVIGHLGEQVREYVRANYSFKSRFVEQDRLLGLGYAVNCALRAIDGGPVLIVLGDTIAECNLTDFLATGDAVLGVKEVEDPRRFGIVELSDGYVVSLEEKPSKPKTNLALVGLYYFKDSDGLNKELEQLVQSGRTTSGEIQLTDALAALLAGGAEFVPFEIEHWYDCGTRETLLATNRFLLKRTDQSASGSNFEMIPPVWVDPSAVVEESTIGPNVSIGANAKVSRSVIRNSLLGRGVVAENVNIKDSLLGPKAVVKDRSGVLNISGNTKNEGK